MTSRIQDALARLLEREGVVRAGELATALAISRQAAHRHLRAAVEAGALVRHGSGRGAHYRRPGAPGFQALRATAGLEEDRLLAEVLAALPGLRELPANGAAILAYAFTELVNNAIDHSGAPEVAVAVRAAPSQIQVEIVDEGVGAFERLRAALGLADELSALQELMKGKRTSQPARHTGEGIFFSSKAVDLFELESGRLRLTIDNVRGDMAVGDVAPRRGTRVWFQLSGTPLRSLEALFRDYAPDLKFSRTRTHVKLYEHGTTFVSRSEAKRLLVGLEPFDEVVLDFAGVSQVGQGFVDEIFRVYAAQRPGVKLEPVNLGPAVEFMVRRALAPA